MKKKVARTILSMLSIITLFGLSSLSSPAKASDGWIHETAYCWIHCCPPIFLEVYICDEWGGECPTEFCCLY